MKLYTQRAACSLASHIIAYELGLDMEVVRVDRATHRASDGQDYLTINPNGYVPTLVLDDGEILTEGTAILQYLAGLKPETGLMPEDAKGQRLIQSLLNFIATELHKGFGPLWKPNTPAEYKTIVVDALGKRFDFVAPVLAAQPYLTGERFTIADAYLFTILNWAKILKVDLARWPSLGQYLERVAARPRVQQALRDEHLLKAAA